MINLIEDAFGIPAWLTKSLLAAITVMSILSSVGQYKRGIDGILELGQERRTATSQLVTAMNQPDKFDEALLNYQKTERKVAAELPVHVADALEGGLMLKYKIRIQALKIQAKNAL